MGNVKLKDIADLLGVSTVTVSNALAGRKGVSNEIREKVINAAREMGYDMSKYDKKDQGATIGVIVAEKYLELGVSFYWSMYQQVAYAASKNQSVTVLEPLEEKNEENGILPKMIREKNVDGVIVIGWVKSEYMQKLVRETELPLVQLDFVTQNIACDAVVSANLIGMYKVTRYLVEKGHTSIAFVGSVKANENIMDRYFGYRKALEEKGIPLRKEWCLEDRDIKTGKIKFTLPENMPTAFACNSDLTAGKVYDALIKKGYRVPEDISIVAYDNYLYGHPFAEKLTTYNVDRSQMAASAVKLLNAKIKGTEKRFGTRYIDSAIVERSSVKNLNV